MIGDSVGEKMAGEVFYPQTNGELSDSITQNWTEQALECYRLNGDCSLCSISKGHYSFVCQMHKVVKKLVKEVGPPPSELDNQQADYMSA